MRSVEEPKSESEQKHREQHARRAAINERHHSLISAGLVAHHFDAVLAQQTHKVQFIIEPKSPVAAFGPQHETVELMLGAVDHNFVLTCKLNVYQH